MRYHFRDKDGLWTKVNLEDVATPEGFARNPRMVHAFYNARRRTLRSDNIRANAAHAALGRLEREWAGGEVLLVTQNIDHLHEQGGSKNLIHMHGEMFKARCDLCNIVIEWVDDLALETECPVCLSSGGMRPHVVWFGEMPFDMERIAVRLGIHRYRLDSHTARSLDDPAGDLAAICDQNSFEHVLLA